MSMSSLVPISRSATRRRLIGWWMVIPVAVVLLVGLVALFHHSIFGQSSPAAAGEFYSVMPSSLEIKIVKDGELQAVNFTDIKSDVEGTTSVIQLVKEGTSVKKGDILVVLDSTQLQQRKDDTDQQLVKAQSALKIAQEMKEIQESQNATNCEAVEVQLQLAQLDLQQYVEGTYPQELQNAQTAHKMAQTNLENKQEDLEQTQSLFAKGFVTAADVKKGELEVTTAKNELQKSETALNVLQKYTNAMNMARLKSAVAQAEQRLARVMKENASMISQKITDVEEKQKSLDDLKERSAKLQQQLDACTMRAPEDGLVLYSTSVDRGRRELIQEGMQVHQNEWLIRLPDTRKMKAVLKVSESQKQRLDDSKEYRAAVSILGVPQPIGASLTKIAVLPDGSQRWWNPDLKEFPVELTLDSTPPGVKPGVRVDAEILVERLDDVLTVPLAAIYSVAGESYVFLRDQQDVRPQKVTIGKSNETHAVVNSGLAPGNAVLLLQAGQGRSLLERAGMLSNQNGHPGNGNGNGNGDARQRGRKGDTPAGG